MVHDSPLAPDHPTPQECESTDRWQGDIVNAVTNYTPPTDAIAFALKLAGFERLSAEIPGFEHADLDTVEGILSESASFFSEAVAPTLRDGDKIGAKHIGDGQVTTPPSYHDAYGKLVESGWLTVQWPEEFGGGGFPFSVNYAMQEVMDSANMAFSLLSINTFGAIDALRYDLGVSVPQQCAVVGFDNIREAAWQAYNLTTIGVDLRERVQALRRMVAARVSEPRARSMVETIRARLVVRGTA